MKKLFAIWDDYLLLNIIGFIFLILSYDLLKTDPSMALDMFTIPLICFLRAIFVKFYGKNLSDKK